MEEYEDLGKPARVYFLDTNLNSPILTTELQATMTLISTHVQLATKKLHFREIGHNLKVSLPFFKKLCGFNHWTVEMLAGVRILSPREYPACESLMLTEGRQLESDYAEILPLLNDLEEALCDGLKSRGLPDDEVKGFCRSISKCPSAHRAAYESWCNFYGRAESRVKLSEHQWTKGTIGSLEVWTNANHALVRLNSTLYASSPNQVLMLKDKLSTRYMMLEHVSALALPLTLESHLLQLFEWQDACLEKYGNEAYNILKAVEPLFKTRLSHVTDNVFGDDTAYTRMIEKMTKKEESIPQSKAGGKMIPRLCKLVEKVNTTIELVEMFGTLKTCGHPIIDAERGGLSAAEEARTPDETTYTDACNLRNTFCHIVLVSYVDKHGTWPPLVHLKKGSRLHLLNEQQKRNIDYNSYPLSDWNSVEWGKFLEFDYFPNYLELMDDKSISLYRSDLALSWDRDRQPKSQRRLLLELMNRDEIDIEAIVRRVSRRDVPEDWRVVSLYPKEREFKLEPRMFAMLPLEMRCFFTAIEANIADSLFRYLPQQTMTKTKTQNQERFLKFTDPAKNMTTYTLFMEIDLSRWNLKWRELCIHMIGHDLNRMFGVSGTFTVTHWFFAMSQIIVRVGGLRPKGVELPVIPETALAWRNHLGGFEGLNQKLWTAATYAMVEMALIPLLRDGTILSYELIGQGDNQVLRIQISPNDIPREERIPAVRDRVNVALETACRSVGQEVKPEENVESTSVLTYSKDVFVSGVEYPTSLKKHSRLFPVTSLDFPSVASNARAIMSGAISGAENSFRPLRSLLVGWYHSLRYLRAASRGYCVHGSQMPGLSAEELLAAVTLPSSVGGMCGPAIASFFYKGGSDPLGKDISGLRLLAQSPNRVGKICSSALAALEERYGVNPEPSLDVLIDNPYGLPLSRESTALSRVGHLTLDVFAPMVRNKSIKPLLSKTVTASETQLRCDLTNIRPFNPVLAHDLYEASGFGTIRVMRKMFVNTRTIQSVAQRANSGITHGFLRADLNEWVAFRYWYRGLPARRYSGKGSYELCVKFRKYWGIDLHGVSNYQPLDFTHIEKHTRSLSSIKWSGHACPDLLTTRGPLSGYIGTATKERRSDHGYKIIDTGAPSRSLMKLQLIRSQAYGNPGFNELLDRIGLTRSATLLSSITDLLPKVRGGSISHRYSSTIRNASASYVGPLNFVTHIRLDTDNVGTISGSSADYPLMMQEFMIMAQAGAKLNFLYRGVRSGEMVIHIPDLVPLDADSLELVSPKFKPGTMPKSKLLYTREVLLSRTFDSLSMSMPRHAIVPTTDYADPRILELSLVQFFVSTLRDKSRAKVLVDTRGLAAIPASFQMDIAEAHALGPVRILKSIAQAVVFTTLRDTFRTIAIHPERWDEPIFAVTQIRSCVRALSNYWRHPLFTTHAESDQFRGSTLRYSAASSTEYRLVARVRREVSLIYSRPDHPFWSADHGVYSGDGAITVAEALTTLGARSLQRYRIEGLPSYQHLMDLYISFTRLPNGQGHTPDTILSLLQTRYVRLAALYEKANQINLSQEFYRLSQLRGIKVHNDDLRTVLRYARQIEVKPVSLVITRRVKRKFNQPVPPDHCRTCAPTAVRHLTVMWNRFYKRPRGGLSTAGYTWAPLLSCLEIAGAAAVIGSGHGGLADLLISATGVPVTGLDLESDMPKEAATLMNYLPTGIQLGNRELYTQSDLSISTSGDFTNSDIRSEFLASLLTTTTVFIDATGPSHTDLVRASVECLTSILVPVVYTRLIGPATDVWDHLSLHHGVCNRVWVFSHSHSAIEVIVEFKAARTSVHHCTSAVPLVDIELTEETQDLIPPRYNELLEGATVNSISWEGEDVFSAAGVLRSLCVSLLNKRRDIQLLYHERMRLIYGYSVLYLVFQEDPQLVLAGWIADERVETDLFTYPLTRAMESHLVRYCARLVRIRSEGHVD
ncbi:putative RNA-dependent RNA polymerase [Magnaporthe oryzae mymonavirus 1]|nr:putative RNA-dependent RNA polymerase [Magnaporthe oryzae mymonavirus 1]